MRRSKTEKENAQETCTLCYTISTAFPKFEKNNQGQMAYWLQILREKFKDPTRKGKSP